MWNRIQMRSNQGYMADYDNLYQIVRRRQINNSTILKNNTSIKMTSVLCDIVCHPNLRRFLRNGDGLKADDAAATQSYIAARQNALQ